MNNLKWVFVIIFVILRAIDDVDCDCILSLKNDMGSPSPVFIRNGAYLSPDTRGAISFRRSETLEVACPGTRNYIILSNNTRSTLGKYNVLEAHCIINSTFRVDRWIGHFKNLSCKTQPWFNTEETKEVCREGSRIHRVGYKLKTKFYTLYEVCFDKYLVTTHYVKHRLTPQSKFMQPGVTRPSFFEGSLFNEVRMSELYKIENQRVRFDEILGKNMSHQYLTKKQSLTRGHMAARADFTLSAEMRATFHYANTAPQLRRGNAGDWAALEDALRRRVQKHQEPVTVYTGVHGVFTLPDARGVQQPVYLTVDKNNNGIVPVPMYFYKVVYDPHNKTAIAFISINSTFYNRTMINDLTFCSDICDGNPKYAWLKWRHNDDTDSFCCNYNDFVEKIDYLPELDVKGEFY